MYIVINFEDFLENGEKIIYKSKCNYKKISSNFLFNGILFLAIICLHVGMIIFALNKYQNLGEIIIVILLISILCVTFELIFGYALIYGIFLAKKDYKDSYYCMTDRRAMVYEKNKLIFVYLQIMSDIFVTKEKDGYGNVVFNVDNFDYESGIVTKLSNSNNEELGLTFVAIEKPTQLCELAINTRDKLLKELNK